LKSKTRSKWLALAGFHVFSGKITPINFMKTPTFNFNFLKTLAGIIPFLKQQELRLFISREDLAIPMVCFFASFFLSQPVHAQTLVYEDFGSGIYSNATVNGTNRTMYAPIGFGATGNFSISTVNVPPGETQTLQGAINFTNVYVPPLTNGVFQIEVASQYAPGATAGGGTVEPFNASAYSTNGALSIELYASVSTTFDIFIGDIDNHVPPSGPWTHETQYTTPMTIPAGVWTDLLLPLNTNAGNWDTNLNTIVWNSITQIFIDAQAPPCTAAFTAGNYSETINYGTIEFIPNPAATNTPVNTPVYLCNTNTPTNTPVSSATATLSPTSTNTPLLINTPTITSTPTITATPTITSTPGSNNFFVSKNVFSPNQPVSIYVSTIDYPGNYSLTIYNSAGENIKNLASQYLTGPFQQVYSWDGKNKVGDLCATGVYVIYLSEPLRTRMARVILIH
jgi:hypothetical protein